MTQGIKGSQPPCKIDGCGQVAHGRGWCGKHYERWRRSGDPLFVERIMGDDDKRFWAKVDVGHPLGCWLWTGAKTKDYGQFRVGSVVVLAHRWAYEYLMGPIPDGLDLDHLCRNPPCVNPDHLEPVTHAENARRGVGGWNSRMKTQCPQGHPYDAVNTYIEPRGRRQCRACRRQAVRKWKAKSEGGRPCPPS